MRKSNINISNPDELNKHLQHSSPVVWVVLGLVIAILAAFFAWSLLFKIKIKLSGSASITGGVATLHVEEQSLDKLEAGQIVYISNEQGILSFNEDNKPIVTSLTLNDGDYTYSIILKEMRPLDFLIG